MDEDREEAAIRVERYYEIQGVDPPNYQSEEWRELFAIQLEKVREEGR